MGNQTKVRTHPTIQAPKVEHPLLSYNINTSNDSEWVMETARDGDGDYFLSFSADDKEAGGRIRETLWLAKKMKLQ